MPYAKMRANAIYSLWQKIEKLGVLRSHPWEWAQPPYQVQIQATGGMVGDRDEPIIISFSLFIPYYL